MGVAQRTVSLGPEVVQTPSGRKVKSRRKKTREPTVSGPGAEDARVNDDTKDSASTTGLMVARSTARSVELRDSIVSPAVSPAPVAAASSVQPVAESCDANEASVVLVPSKRKRRAQRQSSEATSVKTHGLRAPKRRDALDLARRDSMDSSSMVDQVPAASSSNRRKEAPPREVESSNAPRERSLATPPPQTIAKVGVVAQDFSQLNSQSSIPAAITAAPLPASSSVPRPSLPGPSALVNPLHTATTSSAKPCRQPGLAPPAQAASVFEQETAVVIDLDEDIVVGQSAAVDPHIESGRNVAETRLGTEVPLSGSLRNEKPEHNVEEKKKELLRLRLEQKAQELEALRGKLLQKRLPAGSSSGGQSPSSKPAPAPSLVTLAVSHAAPGALSATPLSARAAGALPVDPAASSEAARLVQAAKWHAELLEEKKRQLEEMKAKKRAKLDVIVVPGDEC